MNEFFVMNGDGPYVWAAYGITLAVIIGNALAARFALKRNLERAARQADTEPVRPAKVSQL